MTEDYQLCGWRVRSDLPLPELRPWIGPADALPDVTVIHGPVPDRLESVALPGTYRMVGTDGSVLLRIEGLVRILVQGGTTITVDILRREATEAWRLFLLGSGLGFLCHQRGLFPLHAASLRIGGRMVAVAGHTGIGKSTLALELTRRGHGLLSDDVTVLRMLPGAGAEVLPAFPRLKLWRDTMDALGVDASGLPRVREDMEKYDLRPDAGFDPAPGPLGGVVVLREGPGPVLSAVSAAAAVPLLQGFVFRPRVALHLGRQAGLFAQAAAIARAVPVYRLERPKRFDTLVAAAALIEEAFPS